MTLEQASNVGSRLDDDHLPETNGRMAVCRRCGAHTDTPAGLRHMPDERQLAKSSEWLDMQDRARRIERSISSFRS
jgi:hypothetical protein